MLGECCEELVTSTAQIVIRTLWSALLKREAQRPDSSNESWTKVADLMFMYFCAPSTPAKIHHVLLRVPVSEGAPSELGHH